VLESSLTFCKRNIKFFSFKSLTFKNRLSGYRPFNDTNTVRLNSKIRQAEYQLPEKDWKEVSQEAKDFIKALITVDAGKRLTAKQALDHAWFKVI
jgi:serine/threonine protein kinase